MYLILIGHMSPYLPLHHQLTHNPVLRYVGINIWDMQLAPRLKWSSIGIEVEVGNRLLDAHAESHSLLGKCMDGIHKPRIIG